MRRYYLPFFVLSVLCSLIPLYAAVQPAALFCDNMVLQRGMPVPVWGWANPGEKVTVIFGKQKITTTADAHGAWRMQLAALRAAATPRPLTITGNSNTITIANVVVGEVWICSGQSNMEFVVGGVNHALEEAAAANYPQVRMFTVLKNPTPFPQERCGGEWVACSPTTVPSFSAVGYFFARKLALTLKVPVGMINSSWGGTPAEPWTSLPALQAMPDFAPRATEFEKQTRDYLAHRVEYEARRAKELQDFEEQRGGWYRQLDADDPGNKEHWMDPAYTPQGWMTVEAPVVMGANPLGSYLGSLWMRKTVEIPQTWVGKELALHLGTLDEADDTYVNGVHVGRIWFDTPNFWLVQRHYTVPATAVTSTHVTITTRILNFVGDLGPFGPASDMYLALNGEKPVSLTGVWVYQHALAPPGEDIPSPKLTPIAGASAGDPSSLYNSMIYPLAPYALRGAIWYQGESNAGAPFQYRALLPALINSWRQTWGQPHFYFGIVQLANFMGLQQAPVEKGGWAELREAQLLTAQQVPDTALAVITDIGDANDIHPRNKQDVGLRLALPMLAKAYGKKLAYSGPVFTKMTTAGAALRLHFAFARGLHVPGGKLVGFALAGADKVYHAAEARIEGATVLVRSDAVPTPIAVRFNWANNPVGNLYNDAGLPASPFRSEDWPPDAISVAPEKITP